MSPRRSLLVQVRFSDGRYHGAGNWPPSPARLFQALVSSAGPQKALPDNTRAALEWLEGLLPPTLHAPPAHRGQKVQLYVPHNDLDTQGGDPRNVESIRVGKVVEPHLFDPRIPISYLWTFAGDAEAETHAEQICKLALGLYQLGRGLDAAWATAQILSLDEAMEMLRVAEGFSLRPSLPHVPGALHEQATMLETPVPGTLDSLLARYAASAERFGLDKSQKKPTATFSQPSRPLVVAVPYGAERVRVLYELRLPDTDKGYVPWRLALAANLVQRVRDAAMAKLARVFPDRKADIEHALLGRPVEGRAIPAEQRVQIIPIPSIGHEHVDRGIRRVLVDVPATCSFTPEDIFWAFSGLELTTTDTGEVFALLVAAENIDMLQHHGLLGEPRRRWRTVTPVVLGERYGLEGAVPEKLAQGITDALRHANIGARVVDVRAQRMPFEKHGVEAATFAKETRFSEHTLWHVEIALDRSVRGPLLLGDGRYLGLGLLAPVREDDGVVCLRITGGLAPEASPEGLARALRRAVMARCAEQNRGKVDAYVHGHEGAGPMRNAPHVHYQYDPLGSCLWILAPHVVDHRDAKKWEWDRWNEMVRALAGFSRLLAGEAGALDVRTEIVDWDDNALLTSSRAWETVSPYVANRHRNAGSAHAALTEDVQQSLVDAGLPPATIEVVRCFSTNGGLAGRIRLTFPIAIAGPIVLGRRRFVGGGFFRSR